MIDVHSKLSEFKTETVVTEVLKYIALETKFVYHAHENCYFEHIYFGPSPNNFNILLVYRYDKYILAIKNPIQITKDVSEHTVEDVISKILENIKINKQILIDSRKYDIEQDFL